MAPSLLCLCGTIPSLLNPHHLSVSILKSVVPPLNFINILLCLQSTSTHLASHLQSINLPITSNFERALASSLHPSLALLHVVHFSMCFTSLSESPLNACMSNRWHPKASNPILRSFTHYTLPPNSIAFLTTSFNSLPSPSLITCTQYSYSSSLPPTSLAANSFQTAEKPVGAASPPP